MTSSAFHEGEVSVQQRLGVAGKMQGIGERVIRDHLVGQHREFFSGLQMLSMGSADAGGRPWVSLLTGPPGFAHSPDPIHLRVDAQPRICTPGLKLAEGQRVGLLGLDYSNRRRNRLNGTIETLDVAGFMLRVGQSYGNCPKYIHTRTTEPPPAMSWNEPAAAEPVLQLDGASRTLINGADHFYVASHHLGGGEDARYGVDVSHRGGRPGFVSVRGGDTLLFPDFAGNRFYNTLGNIEADGRAGVAFIDFDEGTVLSVTGAASIDWRDESQTGFPGAQRLVRLRVEEAWLHRRALPFRWRALEPSPALVGTGRWQEVCGDDATPR